MQPFNTYTWPGIKSELRKALLALPNFFRNPVQGMRELPDWEWITLLLLQAALALASGMLTNIVERDAMGFVIDIVLSPLAALIVTGVVSGIFYYLFKFFFNLEIGIKPIYTHLVFAAIPSQLAGIVAKFVPLVNLVGLAASLLLLYVGFVSNFGVNRIRLKRIFWAVFAVFFISSVWQIARVNVRKDSMRMKATPESLDILEKELKFESGGED